MSYFDELNYLYNNRNTSQYSAEKIDEILQRMNEFCGKWYGKATANQVWDFMKLFHNDAPTAQNEFVFYLINDITECFPADTISEIINHLQYLEQIEGDECAFYLIISICRKEEYVKHCLDVLNGISPPIRDTVLAELRKNGGEKALTIINEFGDSDKKFPADAFVLNPPYSASGNGMIFAEKALSVMEKGYVAIIIQNSAGSGKAVEYNKKILRQSTLLASIKMPIDLFIGKSSVQTNIYVFRVGEPHQKDNTVKMLREVEWGEYRLGDLFEVCTYKKRFDANKVSVLGNGEYPYIVRMSSDNGQKGFINEDKDFLNDGNTLSFGQDTATIFYQERPYFTGDKIKVLKCKSPYFGKQNAQFFVAAISRAFHHYSWGTSSYSVEMIEGQKVSLPVKNGEIDFPSMENLLLSWMLIFWRQDLQTIF